MTLALYFGQVVVVDVAEGVVENALEFRLLIHRSLFLERHRAHLGADADPVKSCEGVDGVVAVEAADT